MGEFIGVADLDRNGFAHHPWSLSGGGIADVKAVIETSTTALLGEIISSIGFYQDTHADTAFVQPSAFFARLGVTEGIRSHIRGDGVRDWSAVGNESIVLSI